VWWSDRPTHALFRVLFKEQRLDEIEEAAPNHEATTSNFDALDLLGHHQLVGPGSAEPEHVGCFFYREQQMGIRGHRVSFIGEGRTSDLALMVDGSVRVSMVMTMTDEAHQNPHETPHHWEKFEKSVMNANAPGQEAADLDAALRRRSGGSSIRP
jgi:hypothetical protein